MAESQPSLWVEVIRAVPNVLWPIIVGLVLWVLFPLLKSILGSRGFTVKIAGMELSVQDATEQFQTQIEDLRNQVLQLRSAAGAHAQAAPVETEPVAPQAQQPHVRILWVDDTPSNNAMEIAQIAKWDIDVTQSLSTDEAIGILRSQTGFDAVVSDMGRTEGGAYRAQAGLILLNTMRTAGITAPFMIYSSSKLAQRNREDVLNAGGDGATSSTVELLEWIRKKTGVTVPELRCQLTE